MHLLGAPLVKLDIRHGSNHEQPGYIHFVPEEYLGLWTHEERKWAAGLCGAEEFSWVRNRIMEIAKALDVTKPGPKRSGWLNRSAARGLGRTATGLWQQCEGCRVVARFPEAAPYNEWNYLRWL